MAMLEPCSDEEIEQFVNKMADPGTTHRECVNMTLKAFDRIEIETGKVNDLTNKLNRAIEVLKRQGSAFCLLAETVDFIKEVEDENA